ncbi:MAG: cation-translocating P-type ATPase [Patescibacteria group bacterium]|nr:cation-translocating P-type ATPase [Patescibacteria group bacterium]
MFKNKKFILLAVSLAIIIPLEVLSLFSIHLSLWIEAPITAVLLFIFGWEVFKNGIKSLFKLNFSNINLLMTIAVLGALYLRQFEEAVVIVVLFALAEALEEFGISKSKKALEELVSKTPKTVLLKGMKEKTPIEKVNIGDIMEIRPGDIIPLDGEIVSGGSMVDEATITGEPIPKTKQISDLVYAGTQNMDGYLEARVTKLTKDTTISKIIELTAKAAQHKSNSQQFIEKFASKYTPLVIIIAFLVVVIPVLFFNQPFAHWFAQALTLLVIACPCALVISTPIAIFSAVGNANKQGVLIKGGKFLEELGKIKAIAFDKTRTLTKGEVVVSEIIPFNGYTKEEVLACAAGLESFSEHPLAKGIMKKAEELNVKFKNASSFKAVAGSGVTGFCTICSKETCLGNVQFVSKEHAIENKIREAVERLEKQGKTALILGNKDHIEGIISIEDEIRSESKSLIDYLKRINIIPVILTGDNKSTAGYVGEKLGIEKVEAALLPEDKAGKIEYLKKEFGLVAMVGDGVNDAPALAGATVGIAMGSVGSDAAIENADIAIMDDKIGKIPYLIGLGRNVNKTVKFNVTLAVLTKLVFIILAIVGMSNLAFAIFADVGISVIVILNSLRLLNFSNINRVP